ncbi:hypothetical protein CCP1ISM_5170001 [Azospirillaceae bacterium]
MEVDAVCCVGRVPWSCPGAWCSSGGPLKGRSSWFPGKVWSPNHTTETEYPTMTDDMMRLRAAVDQSADADFLREMIGFAAQRLMELEVETLTGAGHGKCSPDWLTQRNGYRERDWETQCGTVELRIPKLLLAIMRTAGFQVSGGSAGVGILLPVGIPLPVVSGYSVAVLAIRLRSRRT